ncbi:rRNA biogenesis protein, putative [Trypanosoma brucei gambiense DAL972]|uniref:rRNA biogenesis protein, putative n=1 Tax=Trypanosoma brucei gambiense (strain MHOM/CI/86/DAL972) TaxID=679716 RepID=C9ZI84_TRYB9|nr:rRNA biogenesis protein, putative [Trypanosoma brucei gambiense DAL972]CBH08876.1 rRNA biogenesis protein, putative [Trypanosoma brucei gambiense DAL972]|eukprot:XP_011771317.1 rRNA biogenesis protein, putative [Trypanosoma brucei gambiense DAL972]
MQYREYRVHHAAPDGILVQLPGNGGFGKLTVETLGGDALAAALLKRFATNDHIRAVARPTRDVHHYRLLSVQLLELWSGAATYPAPVLSLLLQLFRKHALIGLGTTAMARVVKSSPEKGVVLSLPGGIPAVAVLENVSEEAGAVEVRLLNYDVQVDVVNVTVQYDVVERTPSDVDALQKLLTSVTAGSVVSATVLVSCTDDNCAIVEVPCGDECSVIGYYIYNWPGLSAAGDEKPVVGSCLQLTVEFVPEEPVLQDVLPFFVLSRRQHFAGLPAVRCAILPNTSTPHATVGLVGPFPWRDKKRDRRPEVEDINDPDDDDSDDDENTNVNRSKIRKRKLEETIDAYERSMETAVPSSPEEFQRLLLASPNNSYLWVQWMTHHVSLQQFEEARLVAEKALTTIGVRETQERLNVWVAYMNLENLHGTAESLASVFKRALRHALDELVVYERLADIFSATRKFNQLLSLCRAMVSKNRKVPRVWERLGTVLIDHNKRDQLKRVLKDMSDALKRDEYALVVVHLGVHEYRNGSVENGRALFEGLLLRMPKKSDVWSVYLDQELGLLARRSEVASAVFVRGLFERAVSTSFSAKVMQQVLTRFMSFERAHGTPADVEKVKARARSYVEAKISASVGSVDPTVKTGGVSVKKGATKDFNATSASAKGSSVSDEATDKHYDGEAEE